MKTQTLYAPHDSVCEKVYRKKPTSFDIQSLNKTLSDFGIEVENLTIPVSQTYLHWNAGNVSRLIQN
jgi:hypothetical protein